MCALLSIVLIIVLLVKAEPFAPTNRSSTKKYRECLRRSPLCAVANPLKRLKNKKKTNVLRVESIEEYKEKVVNEKECITVVRFYSSYCRSCRASEPLFYKLASDFSKLRGVHSGECNDLECKPGLIGVNFVEVPLTPDTNILHEALGVPSLPWTHIYHPDAGLVEERRVSKKYIGEVRSCLGCYVYGECDLDDAPADCMNVYGQCAIDE
mmetsp:Transcript_28804/g.62049  ORF Transcript_28804/g.62049 Transcript_28804/m.62049 type:complete len:210 (-) Transcript_28804:1130-1759(-)